MGQPRGTEPLPIVWLEPGAVIRSAASGEKTVNVTEDVELWYSGAAANYGWQLILGERDGQLYLSSPLVAKGRKTWKLQITYEPE